MFFLAWHFFMHMLIMHLLYMPSIRKLQLKALVQVDFLMYAQSKHKHNPHLIGNRKKNTQSYYFVKN